MPSARRSATGRAAVVRRAGRARARVARGHGAGCAGFGHFIAALVRHRDAGAELAKLLGELPERQAPRAAVTHRRGRARASQPRVLEPLFSGGGGGGRFLQRPLELVLEGRSWWTSRQNTNEANRIFCQLSRPRVR